MTVLHSSDQVGASSDLRKQLIFQDLNDQDLLDIAKCLKFRKYIKGEEIIGQYEQDNCVYFILSGVVNITVYSTAGKKITFRDLESGDMFGELAALDGQARSANAVANTDAHIGRVSAAQFRAMLQEFPKVNAATLKYLCGLVRDLSVRVYQFSAYAVSNRIQAEILRLARMAKSTGNTTTISPAPAHADIANRVNTHREAVTKEISRLVRAGLVERSPGKLTVQDIEALKRMAEEVLD